MHQFLLPLLAFSLAAGLLTLTPGLDTVMTLRTATTEGRKAGLGAVLGICLGLSIWGCATAFGITALLKASSVGFLAVKCAGAAYLTWLGINLLVHPRTDLTASKRKAKKAHAQSQEAMAQSEEEGEEDYDPFWPAFRRGVLTDLLNPKIGVFAITFFPQFIPPHVNEAGFALILTALQVVMNFIWLGLLVLMTVPLGKFLSRPVVVRRLDRMTGLLFIGFSAKLLFSEG